MRAAASRCSATASGVGKALEAADLLAEQDLDVTVADARFAKPLDGALLGQLAAEHELLVTVEEGVLQGGFGSGGLGALQRDRASRRRACCASGCPTGT